MSAINLHNKRFRLLENSAHGTVSDATIFLYSQKGEVVTAMYKGGGVIDGQILAIWRSANELEMRYHCIMDDHSLKAGKAMARVLRNDNELIELHLNWEWLGEKSEHGESVYIEVEQLKNK